MSSMKRGPENIPNSSGVYFFRNQSGEVLYLGKAINLKNRIASYFNSRPKDPRIAKMLELAKSVDWQETNSEIEALILESQLIKKHRPPFNIMLRDDKQYFYVVFTKENFPRIFITHQPSKMQNAKIKNQNYNSKLKNELQTSFIGPFTDGTALKTALRLLRKTFPYCTCKQKHNNYCLNYHIGNCPGFCCLKIATSSKRQATKQEREYKKNINAIRDVLSGKRTAVIKQFEKEMRTAAEKGGFEKAADLRDKIKKLEKIFENARILNPKQILNSNFKTSKQLANILKIKKHISRIEGYDIANIQGEFAVGAMVVFEDGLPAKNEYRKFKIKTVNGANDTAMLKEILTRRFNHPEWPAPDLIIVDGGVAQLSAARTVISRKILVIALTKNDRHLGEKIIFKEKSGYKEIKLKKLPPAVRNLILQIDSEAHRFAIGYYRKLHRGKL